MMSFKTPLVISLLMQSVVLENRELIDCNYIYYIRTSYNIYTRKPLVYNIVLKLINYNFLHARDRIKARLLV